MKDEEKDIVTTIMEVENPDEGTDQETHFTNIQKLINQCMWSLQGSFGRTMMDAIESGYCCLGRSDCRDFYGNHVPSRDQVQEGTKGSVQYVRDRMAMTGLR